MDETQNLKTIIDPLHTKLDNLQKTVDLLYKDLDVDRQHIAEIQISQAKMNEATKQLVGLYTVGQKRLTEKVTQTTEDAVLGVAGAVKDAVRPVMVSVAKDIQSGKELKKKGGTWTILKRIWQKIRPSKNRP